jgi:hypothetical protein
MKNVILVVCFFSLISCRAKAQNSNIPGGDLLKASWIKYKVEKIDSIENVYLIYGRYNGQLYKILSHRQNDSIYCRNIFVGNSYTFKLHSLIPKAINGIDNSVAAAQLTTVSFYGTPISKEKGCVDDLFFSENIKGLCY